MTDILNKITAVYRVLKEIAEQAKEFNRLFTVYLESKNISTDPSGYGASYPLEEFAEPGPGPEPSNDQ